VRKDDQFVAYVQAWQETDAPIDLLDSGHFECFRYSSLPYSIHMKDDEPVAITGISESSYRTPKDQFSITLGLPSWNSYAITCVKRADAQCQSRH
jgi:hypothetical protein